jgi:hypothetical protein
MKEPTQADLRASYDRDRDDAIDVCDIDNREGGPFGVILLCKSGKWYTNQTDGIMCSHPRAEGIYVQLPIPEYGWPHLGCDGDGGEPEDVTAALDACGLPFEADRWRWDLAEEAWWPIRAGRNGGILVTWNCD